MRDLTYISHPLFLHDSIKTDSQLSDILPMVVEKYRNVPTILSEYELDILAQIETICLIKNIRYYYNQEERADSRELQRNGNKDVKMPEYESHCWHLNDGDKEFFSSLSCKFPHPISKHLSNLKNSNGSHLHLLLEFIMRLRENSTRRFIVEKPVKDYCIY